MDNDTVSTVAILIENLSKMKDCDHRNGIAKVCQLNDFNVVCYDGSCLCSNELVVKNLSCKFIIDQIHEIGQISYIYQLAFLGFDPDILFGNECIKSIVQDAINYNIRVVFLPNN